MSSFPVPHVNIADGDQGLCSKLIGPDRSRCKTYYSMCAVLGVFFGFKEMHPRPGGWASFRKENLGELASRKLCGLLGALSWLPI